MSVVTKQVLAWCLRGFVSENISQSKLEADSLLYVLHSLNNTSNFIYGDRGGSVVKVLCYKSEGRWFDSRWCHWKFSLT